MHSLLIFKDQSLLDIALTHRSFVNENPGITQDNERLEFLGDALLTFLSGEYLYRQCPVLREDEMTRRRSKLVDEKQLAEFARKVGLDKRMRLGQGAIREGGLQNPNLLSSTFEAVIGAYYLDRDRNLDPVRAVVEDLFASEPPSQGSTSDFKNQFQEWVQANTGSALPKYVTKRVGGVDHAPEYRSRVYVGEKLYGEGKGSSKKEAEKRAAEDAIDRLKQQGL